MDLSHDRTLGRRALRLGMAALAWGLLAALAAGCRESDLGLERVQRAGVLRVGMDPSWPPFEYVDPDSGQVAGLDVDLARAIGERLGVEVQVVPSGWEGLYEALLAGQFDVAISALPYDPWRTQQTLYSISYFNAGPVIVAHIDRPEIERERDLAGRVVHVETGSEGDVQARRLRTRIGELTIAAHDTAADALAAAAEDPESAAVVDAVSARLWIREHGALRIAGEPLYDESYAIAIPPQYPSLQSAIDQALIEMRERGELEALIAKWL